MPRVRQYGMPEWQRAKTEELRERYGGSMSASAVAFELGVKNYNTYTKWLEPLARNSKTKKYDTAEVARKMYEEREKNAAQCSSTGRR